MWNDPAKPYICGGTSDSDYIVTSLLYDSELYNCHDFERKSTDKNDIDNNPFSQYQLF